MRAFILAVLLASSLIGTSVHAAEISTDCAALANARAVAAMSIDEKKARRQQIMEELPEEARAALCKSSTMITNQGYREQLVKAAELDSRDGNAGHDSAELYFFAVCGEDLVGLSPLAYHAFNLNRDDYGFLGEMTLAILWMSIAYLDIDDPDTRRSFMDAINRILTSAKDREMESEVRIYEDLLTEIEGYREDYALALEQCGLPNPG